MNKISYVIKTTIGSLFFSFMVSGVLAQNGTIEDLQLKPMRLPALQEVGGSPFLTPDYKLASVQVSDEKAVEAVPVKFNIFSNAVMVQKDGQELRLESFQQVSYDVTETDGSVKHFIFKQGYPDVDKNSAKTIYQVLSIGPKVHLLKLLTQKVEDAPTLGDYSRREIVTSEQLYVYVPGGEIKKIRNSKKDLVAALPSLSAKIDEIAGAKDLKLKSESEITLLVEELNKP